MIRQPFIASCLALVVCGAFTGCESTGGVQGQAKNREWDSWREQRDKHVVKQRLDYSCGAAALATLMKYYFNDPVQESDLLRDIFLHLTPEELRNREQEGLSLLDLQKAAERRGYQAVGVQLPLQALPDLGGPVLVHLETKDYRHYAVLRGKAEDRIFLADPSRGNIRIPVERFAKQWTTVALVLGKKDFGLPADYPLAVKTGHLVRPEELAAKKAVSSLPVSGNTSRTLF